MTNQGMFINDINILFGDKVDLFDGMLVYASELMGDNNEKVNIQQASVLRDTFETLKLSLEKSFKLPKCKITKDDLK